VRKLQMFLLNTPHRHEVAAVQAALADGSLG
jgi:hypothetical protein